MLAWLTRDSLPTETVDLVLRLPADQLWQSDFLGAFLLLTLEENWESHGTLTPAEMADEWRAMFFDFEQGVFAMVPVGVCLPFAGASIPGGWLLCDGATVSRTTYAALFAVIGEAYGPGDGSTTFELPYLAGKVPVGLDVTDADFNARGKFGGQKAVTLELSEIPEHTHIQDSHTHTQNGHTHTQDAHNHTQNSHNHTQNAHSHTATFAALAASGTGQFIIQTAAAGSQAVAAATPTNIAGTATNIANTATNQAATATNQATTATNQNSGGEGAHNNMTPYLVVNYIIKF